MQDPRMPKPPEIPNNSKSRKKKLATTSAAAVIPVRTTLKPCKRIFNNEFPQQDSDSLPDSSTVGNEYRALRRKYLLLEDESAALGTELMEVEDKVKTLEDEKLALLDQLVVLEGLIDPSEAHPNGLQSM